MSDLRKRISMENAALAIARTVSISNTSSSRRATRVENFRGLSATWFLRSHCGKCSPIRGTTQGQTSITAMYHSRYFPEREAHHDAGKWCGERTPRKDSGSKIKLMWNDRADAIAVGNETRHRTKASRAYVGLHDYGEVLVPSW